MLHLKFRFGIENSTNSKCFLSFAHFFNSVSNPLQKIPHSAPCFLSLSCKGTVGLLFMTVGRQPGGKNTEHI